MPRLIWTPRALDDDGARRAVGAIRDGMKVVAQQPGVRLFELRGTLHTRQRRFQRLFMYAA
jgi:hypothetical protein